MSLLIQVFGSPTSFCGPLFPLYQVDLNQTSFSWKAQSSLCNYILFCLLQVLLQLTSIILQNFNILLIQVILTQGTASSRMSQHPGPVFCLLNFSFVNNTSFYLFKSVKVLVQWIMDQVPLGNKTPRTGYARQVWCPACRGLLENPEALSSGHVLLECMVVEGI